MDAVYSLNVRKLKQECSIKFVDIYQEYKHKIYTHLVYLSNGNKQIAEEVFSDTIYSALLSAPKLYKKTFSWLIQIANRRFCDYLRNQYREKRIIDKERKESMDDFVFDEPDENYKILMLKTALEFLKPKYKEVIKLKYFEDRSQKEIAEILKTTRISVESLIYRSREALKKEVKKIFKEEF
jgi:RNA polymerase sigma-70 factor, ECF subfamily